jgi:hypothetical protein
MTNMADRVKELEARIQKIEDDKAIRELLARYGYTADQGRGEAYVELYTDDGVLDMVMGPNVPAAGSSTGEKDDETDAIDGFLAVIATAERPAAALRK